jgi:type IV secretory pathway protease TraF
MKKTLAVLVAIIALGSFSSAQSAPSPTTSISPIIQTSFNSTGTAVYIWRISFTGTPAAAAAAVTAQLAQVLAALPAESGYVTAAQTQATAKLTAAANAPNVTITILRTQQEKLLVTSITNW